MTQEFTAKKVLLKNTEGDYLIPYTEKITSSDVTTALGYTPYNSTNPDGYITKDVNDLSNYTLTANLGSLAFLNKITNDDVDGTINQDKITDLSTTLSGKQDTISDLSTIRSNATNGQSAYTTISGYGNIVTHNVSEFATSAQGTLADSALQPKDNITELTNNAGYITGITSANVTDALGYTPYNSTNPDGYITNAYHDSTKQDTLTAGTNIKIENNVISVTGDLGAKVTFRKWGVS